MGMSSGGGGSSKKVVSSDINVTPLIDVLLVLLIIFLVVMPIMMKKETLTVPRKLDESQEQPDPNASMFNIKLLASGGMLYDDGKGEPITIQPGELLGKLRDPMNALKPGTEKVVFVDFEDGVRWENVVQTMDSVRTLASDPDHDEVKVALAICDHDKRKREGCEKPQ
jgi:biopolymer transport protein ExbD